MVEQPLTAAGGPLGRRQAHLRARCPGTGPARPRGGSQRPAVRMALGEAELVRFEEAVRARGILERCEGDGQVEGAPEGLAPLAPTGSGPWG